MSKWRMMKQRRSAGAFDAHQQNMAEDKPNTTITTVRYRRLEKHPDDGVMPVRNPLPSKSVEPDALQNRYTKIAKENRSPVTSVVGTGLVGAGGAGLHGAAKGAVEGLQEAKRTVAIAKHFPADSKATTALLNDAKSFPKVMASANARDYAKKGAKVGLGVGLGVAAYRKVRKDFTGNKYVKK